ncbi:pseudouridine synthase [Sphingomonas sp. Mn802worker]|uniref:pseudouridine synthase n=1 Tax=Sphingomonas sp. Mn802worker TaxID=629773 RepID=UPI0003667AFF|nr:pseudouridine synthase [Sphingomonas sp. Mn802worker]
MAEDPQQQRIAKLLARAGVASRRDVERMIADRRVAVGGTVIDTPATLLANLDGVTVDGEPVAAPEPTRLFLFHKPAGYLTAARDPAGRPTIYDRLPTDLPRLVPIGRLDLNTEGLLLLTTDGAFKRQLELPSTGVERAYRARAYGDVTQAQLEELIDGVEVEGVRYGSIDANLERRTGANVWVEMILTEGKNREVRRVLEYLGLQVSRLIRTRYGPFVLGDLPVGAIGEVRGADLVAFRQTLKASARAKGDADATISAPALRKGDITRRTVGPPPATGEYDPTASNRRPSTTEPDRRLRRAAPPRIARAGVAANSPPIPVVQTNTKSNRDAARPTAASPVGRAQARLGAAGPSAASRQGDQQRGERREAAAVREQSAARVQRQGIPAAADDAASPRPAKLQRKAGWAKPKPKAGPRGGRPRK